MPDESNWRAATLDLDLLRRIIQIVTDYESRHGKAPTATEVRVLLRQQDGPS